MSRLLSWRSAFYPIQPCTATLLTGYTKIIPDSSAILPEKAFKPNRVKIVALRFFLAIASSVGMLLMMASFDRQIRGFDALEHVLGHRPLAVIPYLFIKEEWDRKKHLLKLGIILTICIVIVVATALHFLYMPLNLLFAKIFAGLM